MSWTAGAGKDLRYGLASSYYKNIFNQSKLNPNDLLENKITTKVIIRDSSFRLPQSPDSPLVLMATGTGTLYQLFNLFIYLLINLFVI